VCSREEAGRMDVTIVSQSYSATNWQKEVCHFQNALKSPPYASIEQTVDKEIGINILNYELLQ
jgi:hypothetical protein